MSSIRVSSRLDVDKSVIGVIKVRIDVLEAPALLAEAIEALDAESKDLAGFLAAQVLLSVDNKTLVVLSEWRDDHAWSQSRYDARIGTLMEHCLAKSSEMEVELYKRQANIPRIPAS